MNTTTARHAYKSHSAQHWTRADMLLELYDAAIRSIRQAMQAHREQDTAGASISRLKAIRVVQGIAAGIDLNQGAMADNVWRLCDFVQHSLLEGTPEHDLTALRVLSTLKEGFAGIREEANRMEASGELPPVPNEPHFEMHM